MLSYLILSAATFSFSGGSDQDLLKALRTELKLSCAAMLLDEPVKHKPTALNWEEPKDLLDGVRQRLKVEAEDKVGAAWSRGNWPLRMYDLHWQHPEVKGFDNLPDASLLLDAGLVTVETSGSSVLTMGTVSRLELKKGLTCHWYFADAVIAASAEKAPENEFLATVAKAVGAKFREDDHFYFIDFDPEAFRRRALRTLELPLSRFETTADRAFKVEVMKVITAEDLTEIYRSREGSKMVALPQSPRIMAAARARMDALQDNIKEIIAREADFDKPIGAEVRATGKVLTTISLKGDGKFMGF